MGIYHTRNGQWPASKRLPAWTIGRCPSSSPGAAPSQQAPAEHETLAAVAHELRLPLSHIKGFVTSLRRTDVNWDEETRRDFLAEIELEADRLAQLVDELCAPRTTTERGPMVGASDGSITGRARMALTHPSAVIHGALQRIGGSVGERPLRVDVPSNLPSVRIDASQMERVLANLIQNAIKYTPDGTAIGVSARMSDVNELELSVEDEGPGISPEDREQIFEPFFREEHVAESRVPGFGLGLAICKSIVLAHGGRIQVTDRPGGGAHFSVFVPAGIRRQPLPGVRRPTEPDRRNARPARVAA